MKKTFFYQKRNDVLQVFLLLWLMLFLAPFNDLSAQCSPDITPPLVLCPANVVVSAPLGQCSVPLSLFEPTLSDNCSGAISLVTDAPVPFGSLFPLGVTNVTFTATDVAGNSASCQITVTVNGGIQPPACNDMITVPLDPSGTTTIYPENLLEGGPYNCATTGLALNTVDTPTPSLSITGTGTFIVVGCVSSPFGGWNYCWGNVTIASISADCNPDATPPTAICNAVVTAETNTQGPGIARIQAVMLNNGSMDNCTAPQDLEFRVTADAGNTPPGSTYIDVAGVGNSTAYLWVGDQAGNWSNCTVQITTTPPQCTPDVKAPLCIAPPDVTITNTAFAALGINFSDIPSTLQIFHTTFGSATVWDNCENGNSLQSEYFLTSPSKITRTFSASDFSGNVSEAVQIITILNAYTIHVPGWQYPGDPNDSMTYVGDNLDVAYSDLVFVNPCINEAYKIERTWTFIDWLFTPQGNPVPLPLLDIDNDGVVGDPYDVILVGDSLWLYQNGVPTQPLIKRASLYSYLQVINNTYPITGTVFLDTQQNCALDNGEPTLEGWKVKLIGLPSNNAYTAMTDSNGKYTLQICPSDTAIEISLDVPFNYAGACPSVYQLSVSPSVPAVQNIPVYLDNECAILAVDIATPYLRPCFHGNYSIDYYNYSNQTILNTYVDVALDTFVQLTSSSLPGVLQSGNTYRFQTGNLAPGAFGQFHIDFLLDCQAPVGLTHCTEAFIYPSVICPIDEAWSGAQLRVDGSCDGDSVRLKVTNIGTNTMTDQLDYVVTEDLIMARTMPYQLGPGDFMTAAFPSNGATWRMETLQEPGYPWTGVISATVEGCGGLNTPGLVNVFPMDDADPFSATDCTQNSSSFDPNDKQGFPSGYGNEHFIRPNTDIEYKIRFQNTGTDTAFTVVILDTLSQYLDISSIRPGTASHDFDFDILNGNVLRFRFDHILLPDSNVNEVASHGFVQFRVKQQPDNPLGTVIPNQAAIYFDFNDAVITNTTIHTIGEMFITVATNNPTNDLGPLRVYPNPASDAVFFELSDAQAGRIFELTDGLGRTVLSSRFADKVFRFERGALPAGVYFFRIQGGDEASASGKIMLRD